MELYVEERAEGWRVRRKMKGAADEMRDNWDEQTSFHESKLELQALKRTSEYKGKMMKTECRWAAELSTSRV